MNLISRAESQNDEATIEINHLKHFIDNYVPVRVSKTVEEFLRATLPETQLVKLETCYMQQVRILNENLLREEKQQDLKTISKQILKDLNEVIDRLNKVASRRGIYYDVKKINQDDSQYSDLSGTI